MGNGNEVVKTEAAIAPSENKMLSVVQPMTVDQLTGRMSLIQSAMKNVMGKGVDYGTIEGCGDKPTLLEPGAEKLMCLFRLSPKYETLKVDLPNGHREYSVKCILYAQDGTFNGEGIGCASTMESKWRYRSENTGREVPKEYWDTRNPELLGGTQYSTRKIKTKESKDKWFIFHKVDHDNPADYYNTCMKMAAKRAKVAATRGATAASFLFSQDLDDDDIADNVRNQNQQDYPQEPQPPRYQKPQEKQQSAPPQSQDNGHRYGNEDRPQDGQDRSESQNRGDVISDAQAKRMFAIIKNSSGQSTEYVYGELKRIWGYASSKDILRKDYNDICAWLERGCQDEPNA